MNILLLPVLAQAAALPVEIDTPILIMDPEPAPVIPWLAPPPPPPPPALSDALLATIDAAVASGDEKAAQAVFKFAKQANPRAKAEIENIQKSFEEAMEASKAAEQRKQREALAAAGPLEYWDGQAEIGASRSTGNTDNLGLYASLNGQREGLRWRHKFTARAELQKTDGVTSTERVLLSWQPNYKFDDRLYAFGLGQYEHDRSLGYDSRYTAGGGVGYGVIAREKMKLDFEGGPALRLTQGSRGDEGLTMAGRASLSLKWKISPTLELSQNSAVYYEPGETSASAQTALDTRLLGKLKARFSYNLLYEGDAPRGAEALDAISRATLVYSF